MSFEGSGEWMNPPPPGTVDDPHERYSRSRSHSRDRRYKSRHYSRSTSRSRSRSHSHDRYSKHRRRRSHSRDYRRRRSRSSSRKRYDKKYKYRRYSRSPRRHRRSYSHSHSPSPHKRGPTRSPSYTSSSNSESDTKHRMDVLKNQEYTKKLYSKRKSKEIEEPDEPVQENTFKNDGSFLEMFKKMQEQQAAKVEPEAGASDSKKSIPIFGKRRGGRILKTGMVQKAKNPNELDDEPKDAWSVYMKEVRKYKEACCDDDSKTRALIK